MHCMAFFLVVPCSSSVDFSTNSHSPKIERKKKKTTKIKRKRERRKEQKQGEKQHNNIKKKISLMYPSASSSLSQFTTFLHPSPIHGWLC